MISKDHFVRGWEIFHVVVNMIFNLLNLLLIINVCEEAKCFITPLDFRIGLHKVSDVFVSWSLDHASLDESTFCSYHEWLFVKSCTALNDIHARGAKNA